MRPSVALQPFLRLLCLAVFLILGLTPAHADPVTGPWTSVLGTPTMSNTNTASPTWGDGTTDNASISAIAAAFPLITLANPGDKVTMTGTADMLGITSGNLAFRFGLFNVNGSTNSNGWLGYFVASAAANNGQLDARNSGNTAFFTSTNGVTTLSNTGSSGSTSLTSADNPVTFSFSFTIERTSNNSLLISTSLLRPSDSAQFAAYSNIEGLEPLTFSFDRVGFQATNALAADQIQMHNIDVTYTSAVPEPSTYALILSALCLLGTVVRRRRVPT